MRSSSSAPTSSTTSSFDYSAVRMSVPVVEARRRAAAHGRRRAAADVPGERARSAAQGAADRPAAGARQPGSARSDSRFRGSCSARRIATAHRPTALPPAIEALTVGRSAGVLSRALPARQRDADRRRRRHAGHGAADAREGVRQRGRAAGMAALDRRRPGGAAARPHAQIYLVDKPERRAVADSHRLGRRAALDRRTTRRSKCSTRFSAARSPRASTRTCARSTATRYGASSAFDMRLSAGPFLAAAGVQTDKTARSAAASSSTS